MGCGEVCCAVMWANQWHSTGARQESSANGEGERLRCFMGEIRVFFSLSKFKWLLSFNAMDNLIASDHMNMIASGESAPQYFSALSHSPAWARASTTHTYWTQRHTHTAFSRSKYMQIKSIREIYEVARLYTRHSNVGHFIAAFGDENQMYGNRLCCVYMTAWWLHVSVCVCVSRSR